MKKLLAIFISAIMILSLSACVKKIENMVISDDSLEIMDGKKESLSVAIFPEDAEEDITWRSANEKVAKVAGSGDRVTVVAVSPGTTTIIASSTNGVTAECELTVTQKAAYDRLSDAERAFVNSFTEEAMSLFKNPRSIVVNKLWRGTIFANEWVVNITAENGFGARGARDYFFSSRYGCEFTEYYGEFEEFKRIEIDSEALTEALQDRY